MRSKKFTSTDGWFSMTVPAAWEEYDDEAEGSYAFFNGNSWTGNFRITPIRNSNPASDIANTILASELATNKSAEKAVLGKWEAVFYKTEEVQEGEEMVIYHWIAGKSNTLFICSFTIDRSKEGTKENDEEIELVKKIISSIYSTQARA